MAIPNAEQRAKIRELVKQVLDSVPAESVTATPVKVAADAQYPQHIRVNSLEQKASKPYDRDESSKTLITEDDLRGLEHGSRVRVSENVKFTPLASDIVREKELVLITKTGRDESFKVSSVAIGADHGGFKLKEQIKEFLADKGMKCRDFGTDSEDAVDYPDIAHAVATSVGSGHVEAGIIVDGAGIGSAMAANKVPGVRAAACYSTALAANSREHNGANVITLGSGQNSFEEVKQILTAFLSTEISEERHKRRVAKIIDIDRQYRK